MVDDVGRLFSSKVLEERIVRGFVLVKVSVCFHVSFAVHPRSFRKSLDSFSLYERFKDYQSALIPQHLQGCSPL